MTKKKIDKTKKINFSTPKSTIQELQDSRTGGQIALTGFTYQFLYSCYLILSEIDENTVFYLEGIEDIDKISLKDSDDCISHIQLKYSTQKQDASFLKDVLKNYLEAYLINKNRNFKLIYDFQVASKNLSKLFDCSLDTTSNNYWAKIIEKIKEENPFWNWNNFSYDSFISKLSFEKKEKSTLSREIEKLLIDTYDIVTDNISIFANGLKICCLEKMEHRNSINKNELDTVILNIKDDISKGVHNPAHSWIKKVVFESGENTQTDYSYYEGKKPSYQDIARHLPVKRTLLEKEVAISVEENRVTVIKASSGQGKTTLALKVAYDLQEQYTIYQLLWCNDHKELSNIVSYFATRVKMGEKPLIIIDNLDSQLSEWNKLAQLLQDDVTYHYRLVITTREDDWYNYSGDLSNVRSLQVVKLFLSEEEAQSIFKVLSQTGKLHPSITDWRKSFRIVEKKKLLIEYIYLLTHGEMLSERINNQIIQISGTNSGKIKCEILRKICFADICGIKLSANKLIGSLTETTSQDYGELLKSIENEFLIRIDSTKKHIEGLHPVRSQHIVDKLHEFIELETTALQVINIADSTYYAKLFSCLPKLISNKENFYLQLVEVIWDKNNLTPYVDALRGIFSGSVMKYYLANQSIYDDANEHGGLFLLDMELNPFTKFEEIDTSLNTLDDIQKIVPANKNIEYLGNLRNTTPKIDLSKTDIYFLCKSLHERFKNDEAFNITSDITSYATIIYWLINIDHSFNLSNNISLKLLWERCNSYSIDTISTIMYTCFCGNRESYMAYVYENLDCILAYLRNETESLQVYVNEKRDEIHVNYILFASEINKGNDESVARLKTICKMLPIFDTYCADAIKPVIDVLSGYEIPNDAHKTMPIRNIVIMFHQEFTSLWSKTILSNYECDSVYEWLEHWFFIRTNIVNLTNKIVVCIHRLLEQKQLSKLTDEIDELREKLNKKLIREYKYPYEDRPFDEKANLPEGLSKIKNDFFQSIQNFYNQIVGFLSRDKEKSRLALINLRQTLSTLKKMQTYFNDICTEQKILMENHQELCKNEDDAYQSLMSSCLYYNEHKPSKYFNKYQITAWYENNYKDKLIKTREVLSDLSAIYSIVFPTRYFCDGILKNYPLIANNFDIADGDKLFHFLYLCTPFAELEYDYLILLCCNKSNILIRHGLKIPKRFFETLKQAVENEDETLINEFTPAFPVEVTSQMVECFSNGYDIEKPAITGYENVDRVGELLWAFSKSRQVLIDNQDAKYFNIIEKKYKDEIFKILGDISSKIPERHFTEISNICKSVFEGEEFLDVELNAFYNNLVNVYLS
ncbi:P-loop NTPase [Scatolibacter rhodanostii]|uniref:P-loop NTPase n=1 Tax=Scatolibacter rhodanostii TaxID=2014781 RepID=UPI000C07C078|nr:hypothetical protein [Scatolibacter rhodanostii]